jgi:carbamoyl-phosphate synthase large subunit
MRVLVTGAGALLGQGIIRSLKRSSLDAEIISVDPNPLSAGLYWADRRYRVPPAVDPSYLDRMRELMDKERPDAVLVGTDVELAILASHRAELEARFRTHILVSDTRVVEIADDKYLTAHFMREAGFAYPRSCLPGDEEQLVAEVGFPLIVKPRVGARSIGVSLVRTRQELARALEGRDGVVIQECVGTDQAEYTASALVFEGVCNAVIVMRRDLRDGNTYRAFVDSSPVLANVVRGFGEALRPYGPANFQFRLDRDGNVKVFEINARFSGTTPLRAHANFNEVEMCLRHILLGEPVRQPEIKDIIILRHWSETVVTAADVRDFS